jgi:ubiquitin C-terminal hydrolase
MELVTYSDEYLTGVFTLKNNGVLCYLNSLVQSLVSCPSVNEWIMSHKSTFTTDNNRLGLSLIELLDRNPAPDSDSKFVATKSENAISILSRLIDARKNSSANLRMGRQEDIHEGLVLLLDSIGYKIERNFEVRYKCQIHCRKCKFERPAGPDPNYEQPPELMIDLSEENPMIQNLLESKEDIESYIRRNVQISPDYRCEKCGAKNTYDPIKKETEPNVWQIYNLARVSEVIILLFKKYGAKKKKYFPPSLDFPSKGGTLHYEIVSQVEHYGNMSGGHYKAFGKRLKPPGFHGFRREKIYDAIRKCRLDFERTKDNDILDKIQDLENILKCDDVLQKNNHGVFIFDDDKSAYCPKGFEPTDNTYMVFYHLTPMS